MEVVPSVDDRLPRIDARPVGPVVVRLEPGAASQLDVRHNEVELDAALVGVLDPQAVVLIAVEARQQDALELVHQAALHVVRKLALGERQHAGRVPPREVGGVDQVGSLVGVAAQHGCTLTIPVAAEKVARRP